MRLMSDVREAAWGVVQGSVSDLDFDFAGYAERHFERLRAAASGGELERLARGGGGLSDGPPARAARPGPAS